MYFHFFFDSQELVQSRAEASDVGDVQGAVDLPAFPAGPDHPAKPQCPQMPRDVWLAHAEVGRQVVHACLAHLPQVLEDAQSSRVGERQIVVAQLASRAWEK